MNLLIGERLTEQNSASAILPTCYIKEQNERVKMEVMSIGSV